MQIDITSSQSIFPVSIPFIQKIVETVITYEGQQCDELSIHFVTVDEIAELHAQFFDDPSPTDCISFPIDLEGTNVPYRVLGEVFVCPEVALQYAEKHGKIFEEEVMLYLIHGLLHLMGYDDMNLRDKRKMRAAEKRHLKHLATIL